MSEAFYADDNFNEPKKGGNVILFHPVQVKDNFRSKLENTPRYVEKIFITIITAGDRLSVIDRPIREEDKDKYPVEWARWEKTKENRIPGTPMENWQSITDTQKAEFKAMNIFTVEQFAQLPDSMAVKIMGFHQLRDKAKAFAASQRDSELMDKIRREMDQKLVAKDTEIEELRNMLKTIMADRARPKRSKKKVAVTENEPVTA